MIWRAEAGSWTFYLVSTPSPLRNFPCNRYIILQITCSRLTFTITTSKQRSGNNCKFYGIAASSRFWAMDDIVKCNAGSLFDFASLHLSALQLSWKSDIIVPERRAGKGRSPVSSSIGTTAAPVRLPLFEAPLFAFRQARPAADGLSQRPKKRGAFTSFPQKEACS